MRSRKENKFAIDSDTSQIKQKEKENESNMAPVLHRLDLWVLLRLHHGPIVAEVLDAHVVLMVACNDLHEYKKRGMLGKLPGLLVDVIKSVAGDIKKDYGVQRVFVCQALPRCNQMMLKSHFKNYVVLHYNKYAHNLNQALSQGQGQGFLFFQSPCKFSHVTRQFTGFFLVRIFRRFFLSLQGY